MKGMPLTPVAPDTVHYPDSDGEPMAETEAHLLAMLMLVAVLRQYFRGRPDVFVIGNMFWYFEQGNPQARKAPDVMVVKGVDAKPDLRRSFKSWEENQTVPCFILELTSESTAEEDQVVKRELYERLGVREYFLFDPLSEYLPKQLIGYRLIGGRYEELQAGVNGAVLSAELGVTIRPEGAQLVLTNFATRQRLVDLPETSALLEEVRRDFDLARQEIECERRRAEEAERRARDAELRLAALQAELDRLKAAGQPPQTSNES